MADSGGSCTHFCGWVCITTEKDLIQFGVIRTKPKGKTQFTKISFPGGKSIRDPRPGENWRMEEIHETLEREAIQEVGGKDFHPHYQEEPFLQVSMHKPGLEPHDKYFFMGLDFRGSLRQGEKTEPDGDILSPLEFMDAEKAIFEMSQAEGSSHHLYAAIAAIQKFCELVREKVSVEKAEDLLRHYEYVFARHESFCRGYERKFTVSKPKPKG